MILALVDDLFFSSKITGTARQLGKEVRIYTKPEALLKDLGDRPQESISSIILDLNCRTCSAVDLIREIRGRNISIPLLAFLSHVQADLARAAQEAGCDQVVARSYFSSHLAEILTG
ncbi:MAG TPA: response regulator [Acidobacteriota bacterium]